MDGGVVGHIGAWTDANTRERFLCYWLGREFWGRGIASAATSLFLQSELNRPIKALVAKHNIGYIRVLEKAGFTRFSKDAFTISDGTSIEEYTYVFQGQIRDQPRVV